MPIIRAGSCAPATHRQPFCAISVEIRSVQEARSKGTDSIYMQRMFEILSHSLVISFSLRSIVEKQVGVFKNLVNGVIAAKFLLMFIAQRDSSNIR